MGGPHKPKEPSRLERNAAVVDRLMAEIDPVTLAAMILGGTAAVGGIIPPMTRLLMATNESTGTDVKEAASTLLLTTIPSLPTILFYAFSGGSSGSSSSESANNVKASALFASGAVEVFLMSRLFSNPEFMKMLGSAASGGLGLLKNVAATAV